MILRQIFANAIGGYWDGELKKQFDWVIDGPIREDNKGKYIKVGSWEANNWFHVAAGKTDKQTLANARRRLSHAAKKHNVECTFEYIKEEDD